MKRLLGKGAGDFLKFLPPSGGTAGPAMRIVAHQSVAPNRQWEYDGAIASALKFLLNPAYPG